MNRRSAILTLLGMSAGNLLRSAFADNPFHSPASQSIDDPEDFILHSEARLVLLDVSVQNREGGFVEGLSKENFRVSEDGRPKPITVFDHDDLPVTVGIIVDESRSMTPKREEVLSAATTFIQESNPLDEIFVINFNDHVLPGLPPEKLFSGDIAELQAALYRGVPQGKTALYDGVVAGLKQLELGQREKKALVVISDGGDNASVHNRREIVGMVERSIATIYTIGLFDEADPDSNPGILRDLPKITGGEAFFPAAASEMAPVCRRIAQEIRTRYTIGYRPEKGTKSLRRVSVQVALPGHEHIIVRARDRYWYENVQAQN
jgi:VWFA-related protein